MARQAPTEEHRRSATPLPALQHPSLLETAAALPHVRGLSPARSTTAAPPRPGPIGGRCTQPHPPAGRGRAGQDPGRFPCSLRFARRRRSPTVPLRHRCGYAAVLPRSLPGSTCPPPQEFPGLITQAGTRRIQPTSTRFELAPHQGAVKRRFLAYSSPSRLPDPGHLAVLTRPVVVRAAPALPGTTRIKLPSAPPPCCDRASGEGLPPPLEPQRLTAHARSASHRRDAATSGWRRHLGDRAVAGPRIGSVHSGLPTRRPCTQGASAGPHHTAGNRPRPLPSTRQAARLPRSPLTMPRSRPCTSTLSRHDTHPDR